MYKLIVELLRYFLVLNLVIVWYLIKYYVIKVKKKEVKICIRLDYE